MGWPLPKDRAEVGGENRGELMTQEVGAMNVPGSFPCRSEWEILAFEEDGQGGKSQESTGGLGMPAVRRLKQK